MHYDERQGLQTLPFFLSDFVDHSLGTVPDEERRSAMVICFPWPIHSSLVFNNRKPMSQVVSWV